MQSTDCNCYAFLALLADLFLAGSACGGRALQQLQLLVAGMAAGAARCGAMGVVGRTRTAPRPKDRAAQESDRAERRAARLTVLQPDRSPGPAVTPLALLLGGPCPATAAVYRAAGCTVAQYSLSAGEESGLGPGLVLLQLERLGAATRPLLLHCTACPGAAAYQALLAAERRSSWAGPGWLGVAGLVWDGWPRPAPPLWARLAGPALHPAPEVEEFVLRHHHLQPTTPELFLHCRASQDLELLRLLAGRTRSTAARLPAWPGIASHHCRADLITQFVKDKM